MFAVILSIYRSLSDITLTDFFSYSSFLCSAIFTTSLTLSSTGHYRHLPLHHHSLTSLLSSSFSHLPSLIFLLSSHFSHLTSLILLLSSHFSHLTSLISLLSSYFRYHYLPSDTILSSFFPPSFLFLSSFFSLPSLILSSSSSLFPSSFTFTYSPSKAGPLRIPLKRFLGTASVLEADENPTKSFSWDS